MDHIPLPIDSLAHSPWQVPFLSSKHWTYDDQGFLTFPERTAVDTSQLLTKDCSYSILEELAPFLQEWLWFGLLGETIGIQSGMASRAAFIAKRENGTEIITSAELPRCILLASQASTFDDFHLKMYELCIRRALEIVNNILLRWPCTSDFTPSAVYLILFSVQILCETLLTSREVLFPGRQLTPMSSFLGSQLTHIADISLLRASWCWSEIQGLPKQVVLRYYLGFINRSPNRHNNSSACSGEDCVLPPRPDHVLRPIHTTENCLCEEIIIDNDTIIKLTEQGSVPLLISSEEASGKRQFTVLKHSLSTAPDFMAISHVRHLGLGSSTSNALPYCQLSRLQTLATGDEGIMPFWIDTICVPIPRKACKAALPNVRHIFLAAAAVLVVDPCLHRHAVGSATEALLYIKHSNWAKRLWTIQEGALARKLCFQFSNRVWSIDNMLSEYERDRALDILHLLPYKRYRYAAGDDKLTQMLARLASDMAVAETMLGPGHVEVLFDQLKLRSVLRWGYLASPKFYWMVDEGEVWRLKVVVDVLKKVYAAGGGVGEIKSLFERLRFISAVDWSFEGGTI